MTKKLVVALIVSLLISSCKDENKLSWTKINITISSLLSDEFPDSIPFRVQGHKSGDGYLTHGDASLEIDDYIVNGHYEGGFQSKLSGRWSYNFILDDEFKDNYYILPDLPDYRNVDKRKDNFLNFEVFKNHPVIFKSFLTPCTGVGDRIKYIMKHKVLESDVDLSKESENWFGSGSSIAKSISGCDTNIRHYSYPAGNYEIAIKTFVQGIELGYYHFEYEVFKDSVNLLELYY